MPVFQAIVATTRREAWQENQRGLAPADLAMHVVLPELDGRILAGAVSFKAATPRDAHLGERATLLQFSSAFCAPCRATRRTLSDVAGLVPGVEHLEVDAEHHLELVRVLGILRTPTTLVLDSAGREVTRATGAPRREQVLAALGWA